MFHGVMGHGEHDVGYVTMVNLYTLRQFPTPDIGKNGRSQKGLLRTG